MYTKILPWQSSSSHKPKIAKLPPSKVMTKQITPTSNPPNIHAKVIFLSCLPHLLPMPKKSILTQFISESTMSMFLSSKSQEEAFQIKLVDLSAHPSLVTAVSLYFMTMTQTLFTLLPFQVVANKISCKHLNKQSCNWPDVDWNPSFTPWRIKSAK